LRSPAPLKIGFELPRSLSRPFAAAQWEHARAALAGLCWAMCRAGVFAFSEDNLSVSNEYRHFAFRLSMVGLRFKPLVAPIITNIFSGVVKMLFHPLRG
jgi:hypothetical protein